MLKPFPPPPVPRRIYAVDVGSTLGKKKAFAWAVTQPESPQVWGSQRMDILIGAMAEDLRVRGDPGSPSGGLDLERVAEILRFPLFPVAGSVPEHEANQQTLTERTAS